MITTVEIKEYLTKCSSERLERLLKEIEVLLLDRKSKKREQIQPQGVFTPPYASVRPTGTPVGHLPPKSNSER